MRFSTRRVDGQDCSDKSFRHKRQQAGHGCLRKRVASPAEAMTQASVVAWRVVTSWAFAVVQGIEHHKLRRATQKSSTRGSVSVKSRHERVSLPEGQSASRSERLSTQPSPDCFSFQAAGVTFQLPREGRRACLSVGCSLLLFSLLSFFRAGFLGVF